MTKSINMEAVRLNLLQEIQIKQAAPVSTSSSSSSSMPMTKPVKVKRVHYWDFWFAPNFILVHWELLQKDHYPHKLIKWPAHQADSAAAHTTPHSNPHEHSYFLGKGKCGRNCWRKLTCPLLFTTCEWWANSSFLSDDQWIVVWKQNVS